jgi:hypothetical protein
MTPRCAWCHARAGLMLFYNPQHGTGIQISRTASSLVPPPGAHTGTRKRGPRAQLCESSTTVRRSTTRVPGKPWVKTEGPVEPSGLTTTSWAASGCAASDLRQRVGQSNPSGVPLLARDKDSSVARLRYRTPNKCSRRSSASASFRPWRGCAREP